MSSAVSLIEAPFNSYLQSAGDEPVLLTNQSGEVCTVATVHRLEPGLPIQEFDAIIGSLLIPDHVDLRNRQIHPSFAIRLGEITVQDRTPEMPRDPWAADHFAHIDHSFWGINQYATVLYAREILGEAAPTGFFDTAIMLQQMEQEHPGITEELRGHHTVFSVERYFRELLPALGGEEAVARDIARRGVSNLDEIVKAETSKYPPKKLPTIVPNPITANDSIMIDDIRVSRISGKSRRASAELIRIVQSFFVGMSREELAEKSYYFEHGWESGDLVVFTQAGGLHQTYPSPPTEQRRNLLRTYIH